MPYAWYTAWPPGYYQTCCTWSGTIWAPEYFLALREDGPTLFNLIGQCFQDLAWPYQMEQCCQKVMPQQYWPCEGKFQRVNQGLPEAVTRLSNICDQLICWLCIAKKPAFMLIHDFMQWQTQLFSYLDNGHLHWTMELPTAQEKSNQIFLCTSRRISTSSEMNNTVLPPSLHQKWRT